MLRVSFGSSVRTGTDLPETVELSAENIEELVGQLRDRYLGLDGSFGKDVAFAINGDWLCRTWRDEEQPELRLQGLHIYQKKQKTHQPGEEPLPVTARRIWRHWCHKDKADNIDKQIDLKLGIGAN